MQKEFCGVMESKGRKGQCLYSKKWEREPQYKGCSSLEEIDKINNKKRRVDEL